MKNAKVSVIVPVYNGSAYIEEAVNSLLMQSYENTEIIVVNDGSYDNTREILEKISFEYPSVVVINQENMGVSEARNNGISMSCGEFIMFMDSDDKVDIDWIKKAVGHITSGRFEIAIGGYDVKYRDTGKLDSTSCFGDFIAGRDEIIDKVFRHRDILPAIWNKIYYADIIKQNNIKFDSRYAIGEDLLFLVNYMIHVKKAIAYSDRTYCYFLNSDGAMQSHNSSREFKESWLTEWTSVNHSEEILLKNGIKSKSLKVKKVRIADKLISIIQRYGYETPLKKEMLCFQRANALSVIMRNEFGFKKKVSILLNCISPKLKNMLLF